MGLSMAEILLRVDECKQVTFNKRMGNGSEPNILTSRCVWPKSKTMRRH